MTFDSKCISIIIPTYKRPEALERVLKSIDGSKVNGFDVEIVVADNDPLASAADFMTRFMATSRSPITHIHVPEPGVSNARNGALAAAKGRYILFIDDDMEADLGWAQTLVKGALDFDATLAFGPIDAVMPKMENAVFDYMQPLFCRHRDYDTGLINEGIGTGNCFIDRGKETLPNPAFDPALNHSGGEDNVFFDYLMAQGAKVAWIEAATTMEHVPADRATLNFVWRRNFAWGQGPSQHEADKGLSGLPGIIKWMIVGVAQSFAYALLWAIAKLRRRPESVQHLGRLAQGIGKVFWAERLAPKLYGI